MDLAIDLETSSLDPNTGKILQIWLQWGDNERCVVEGDEEIQTAIQAITRNSSITNFIFFNWQFDGAWLGQDFLVASYGKIRDLFLVAKARGELVCSLKHLNNLYLARPGNYSWVQDLPHTFITYSYGSEDIEATWRLWKLWKDEFKKPVVELMNRACSMAINQRQKGTAIDMELLGNLVEEGERHVKETKQELINKYGVDPNQQEELIRELIARGYEFSKKTKTGKDALTAEVLEEQGLFDILEYRRAMKLDSAFVQKIRKLLVIDDELGQVILPHIQTMMGADTGRTTMKDYNHQQSGKKGPVRKLLISRFQNGKIGVIDFAQAEIRAGVYISNDNDMGEWLLREDPHRVNAAEAFEKPQEDVNEDERFAAKALIFRIVFGGRAVTPQQKRVENLLRKKFKRFFDWMNEIKKQVAQTGAITDPWGKTRNLLEVLDYRGKWAVGRAGINSPIQGLSSHFAIWLTVRLWELFKIGGLNSLVLFGVHDSILFDVYPGEEEEIEQLIEQAFKELGKILIKQFKLASLVPMIGELQYGDNFADTKKGNKKLFSTL